MQLSIRLLVCYCSGPVGCGFTITLRLKHMKNPHYSKWLPQVESNSVINPGGIVSVALLNMQKIKLT